jgi:hypothetical protein
VPSPGLAEAAQRADDLRDIAIANGM